MLHVSSRLDQHQAYKNSNIFTNLKTSPGRKFWGSENGTCQLKTGGVVALLQTDHITLTCYMNANLGRDKQLSGVYKSIGLEINVQFYTIHDSYALQIHHMTNKLKKYVNVVALEANAIWLHTRYPAMPTSTA
jgi:hypothetical protein